MKEASLVAIVCDEKQIAKGKKVQPINPLFSLKKVIKRGSDWRYEYFK